jgi:hypothetical protein
MTSLTELKRIEAVIHQTATPQEQLLHRANTLIDSKLHQKTRLQRQVYEIVEWYGRKKLKAELERIHQQLFSLPQHHSFRQRIYAIFTNRD